MGPFDRLARLRLGSAVSLLAVACAGGVVTGQAFGESLSASVCLDSPSGAHERGAAESPETRSSSPKGRSGAEESDDSIAKPQRETCSGGADPLFPLAGKPPSSHFMDFAAGPDASPGAFEVGGARGAGGTLQSPNVFVIGEDTQEAPSFGEVDTIVISVDYSSQLSGSAGADTAQVTNGAAMSGLIDLGGGDDAVIVDLGATAGRISFSSGSNALRGSGTVSGAVYSEGALTVGNFADGAPPSDSALVLKGAVTSESSIRIRAREARGKITSAGPVDVVVEGNIAGVLAGGGVSRVEGKNVTRPLDFTKGMQHLGPYDRLSKRQPYPRDDAHQTTVRVKRILDDVQLNGGTNYIEAETSSRRLYSGHGDDTLVISGQLTLAELYGGTNRVEAGSVLFYVEGGWEDDTFIIAGHVKEAGLSSGTNRLEAGSAGSVSASRGDNTVIVRGDLKEARFGPGSNTVEAGSLLEELTVWKASPAVTAGVDRVSIGGGPGHVSLAGGRNEMTLSGGSWSGDYLGGEGEDIMTVASGAIASGNWSLGGGSNVVRAGGSVSGDMLFGDGNDSVGGLGEGSFAHSLKSAALGGGDNTLRAAEISSIWAGAGDDDIYLRPRSSMALSSLDLGAGINRLWIIGRAGAPAGRKIVVPLSRDLSEEAGEPGELGSNLLYLCASTFAEEGCGSLPGGGHSLSAVLDATRGNVWESVKIGNPQSSVQSELTVKGAVTLSDPALNDLKVTGDGRPGDAITVTGAYEILPPSGGLGTLFELDAGLRGVFHHSDILRFESARAAAAPAAGRSPVSVATVSVRMAPASAPAPNSRLDLVMVDSASDISGVSVQGLSGGEISLNGHVWTFGSEEENGVTTYFLEHFDPGLAPAPGHLIIDGTGDTAGDIKVPDGVERVTVAGDWSGNYTGLPGADRVRVNHRITASGLSWRLLGGDNVLLGSGSILASVSMGGGDDTIGGFEEDSLPTDDFLAFGGPVDLGDGTNRMRAASAVSITGGAGSDTIALSGGATGKISLGGGATANSLTVAGLIEGDVESAAAGPAGVWDKVTIGGGSGSVDLGGGDNSLATSGDWSGSYAGGSGRDVLTAAPGAALSGLRLDFGGGDDAILGAGAVSAAVSLGAGNDAIGLDPAGPDGDLLTLSDNPSAERIAAANALELAGALDLGGGSNAVWASAAAAISAGDGADRVYVSGGISGAVDLGGGANRLEGASLAKGFAGGDSHDWVAISGDTFGDIDLGGGPSGNFLSVGGAIEGNVASSATGLDQVTIGGGNGHVRLGGGANELTISGDFWEGWKGDYEGGGGPDTIRILDKSSVSGDWDLGGGSNAIYASGKLSISITLGDGDDMIQGIRHLTKDPFAPYEREALGDFEHPDLGSVDLGGGTNRLWARSAESITGGSGSDSVYLQPESGFSLPSINLGGGDNGIWILGQRGAAGGRQAAVALSKISGGSGSNTLYLCNEDPAANGCGGLAGETGHAFNAVLDATGGAVDSVRVGVEPSYHQSLLSVRGSVTLADPKLNDFTLEGDGAAGDRVTVTGSYEILAPSFGHGTLFELDVAAGAAPASDALAFDGARAASGKSPHGRDFVSVPSIALRVSGDGSEPPKGSRLDIVTVDSASDVSGVSVEGVDSQGMIVLDGHAWRLSSEESGGATSYYLSYGIEGPDLSGPPPDSGVERLEITGSGATSGDVGMGGGTNYATVSGDWPGNYTGLDGADDLTVGAGVTASGQEWRLGAGDNALRGSGKVLAKVFMGGGDDTIGDFSEDAPESSNTLVLSGGLELGNGMNRVKAASAGPITGGWDSDTIILSTSATGDIDLGGGVTSNVLKVYGRVEGNITSAAVGWDSVTFRGGEGDVRLGGGINSVKPRGFWSGDYFGGPGPDRFEIIGVSASGDWDLGGGDNEIYGPGTHSGSITLGDGDDIVDSVHNYLILSSFDPVLNKVDLGDGDNILGARAVASITAGSGSDRIFLRPDRDFSVSLDLGEGDNSLWVIGDRDLRNYDGSFSGLYELYIRYSGIDYRPMETTRATIPLSGIGPPSGVNRLYLCNVSYADSGCYTWDYPDPTGDYFQVVLDGSGGGEVAWQSIKIGVEPSVQRSELSVRGAVTLDDPELNDFMLVGDGSAGDAVTITGSYEILPPASGRGTLFELDVAAGASPASDVLRFERATAVSGQSSDGRAFVTVPSIALRVSGDGAEPRESSRLDIVTVDSASDVSGVSVAGVDSSGGIVLDGHSWSLSSEISGGATVYFLSYGRDTGGPPVDPGDGIDRLVITGTGETAGDVDLGGGINYVTVVGDWSGSYTGLGGLDDMTVESGITASGRQWSLGGGDNALRGSGTIHARVVMGSGDDTVGGFDLDSPASDSALALPGGLELGDGRNRVRAASAGPITGGADSDFIALSGAAAGHVNLGGGENTLLASSAVSFTGGPGQDTVTLAGEASGHIDLGGGANSLRASSAASVTGGSGQDIIILSGGAGGAVKLGGGAAGNTLEIGGLAEGDITSAATGLDRVSIGGGSGDVRLGGGENELTLSRGSWSGAYEGGDGPDTIRVQGGSASGRWDLGGGDNSILGHGWISGAIILGDGNDTVGGGSLYPALGRVSLGGGVNRLQARVAESISGGSGPDSVYLRPDLDFALSSLDLGGGENSLWVLGREGDAGGRQVTIPLSGGGAGLSRLYLCNEAASASGCGFVEETGHAFHVALDASEGNAWDSVRIGVEPSPFQSRLSVRGSVTLADPKLNDFALVGNGAAGDAVTVTGSYEMLAAGPGRGTLFELDVRTGGSVASDILSFEGAAAVAGQTQDGRDFVSVPSISLRVLGDGSEPAAGSRLELLSVSGSDVAGVSVAGVDSGGSIVLDGHAWSLGSEASGAGTVYYLSYARDATDPPEPPTEPDDGIDRLIITGVGETAGDVDLGGGLNYVTVVGDWTGSYTGLDGVDDMTVVSGVTASGREWRLGGGDNALRGFGTISAKVFMGDGDDTVGGFGLGADPLDSSLALPGGLELGDGVNRVRAVSSGSITGGGDSDTIILSGAASGHVSLGGGTNSLRASAAASFAGGPGKDTVILSGDVTGKAELGDGENRLEASAAALVIGGSGPDFVALGAGASGLVDLKGGLNRVEAESLSAFSGGPDSDTIILRGAASGHVDLGGGENWLEASGVNSVTGGSGPDTIIVDGGAGGLINLGSGTNSLAVAGALEGNVVSGPTGRDDVSIGGGTGSVNLAGGANTLRLGSGAWSGTYDGGPDPDTILVAEGASASGDWKLEGGKDILRGTGEISGEVDMGAGDDIIGNFDAGAPESDSALAFAGHLILGSGHDKVKAASAKSIESTGGAEITLSGGISGAVNLAGGWNRVRAESAGSIAINGGAGDFSFRSSVGHVTLGDSEHPHLFEAKSVGEIVISCPRGGGPGEAAEPCGESRITVGSVTGGISMTSHVSTFMTVNGIIGGDVTSVSAGGNDRIGFRGGEGDIDLGGGENHLALLHGVWSGRYSGGDGADTIRVRGPAKMTGDLHLGEGGNVLTGAGVISGEVRMGDGDDSAGGFLDTGAPGHLMSLSGIYLGGGDNTVVARRAEKITAGAGADRVALFPESELEISELNLGEGDNGLWISGAPGDPGSRWITVPLSGDGAGSGGGDLHICGEAVRQSGTGEWGCADLAGTDYGFNVALDASGGNAWGLIQIDNQYNSHVSQISVTGDVTIKDSRLGFMTVSGNGAAGDSLTMTGSYGIFPYGRGLGTVFELEVDTAALKSDMLRFVSATRLDGDDFGTVAAVRVKAVSSGSSAAEGSRIDLVTVDAASDISGVGVQDLYSGKITLAGESWRVEKETLGGGGAVYFLSRGSDSATVSGGSDDLDFGEGANSLRINGSWEGSYTGGSGPDTVTVEEGVTAFGGLNLGGGNNLLLGSGSIRGDVVMGDGDDTVGSFGAEVASPGDGLQLFGHLNLGGGSNRASVSRAAGITGGDGDDTVIIERGPRGPVALGGGDNYLKANGEVGSYTGGSGADTIELGESGSVSGTIVLGGGSNLVTGSSSSDRITLDGTAVGTIDLGEGDDTIILKGGARAAGTTFRLGPGDNRILAEGVPEGGSGMTTLDLSKFEGEGSLVVCAGQADANARGCGRSGEWISGFSVDLGAGNGNGFSVRVENAGAQGQSLLSASGDLTLVDSSLERARIVTNGGPGKTVTLAGTHSFDENTVIELDVSRGKSDFLRVESTVLPGGAQGASGPLVELLPVHGGTEGGETSRFLIARVDSPSGPELRFSEDYVFLDDHMWRVAPGPVDENGFREYYLAPEGISLGARAAAAQQVLSASGAITSTIAAASASQVRPGFSGAAGVSQDGPGEAGASFWTRFTVAEETERLAIGKAVSEFEQSLWVVNSGARILSQRAAGGELTHSLIAQYGSSSSKGAGGSREGLESSLAGLGYSLLYRRESGVFTRLSAMSSGISGRTGNEEYSLGGSSVSAEAGAAFQTGRGGSILTVSPLARVSYSEFGEVRLRSGDSSAIEKASGALALFADYESGGANGERGSRSLYGGVTVTHDFQGGFVFVPKDPDGNRTIGISVDSGKTWVSLEAGWAWSFGEVGRAFVEAAQASASGESTGGERRSWTLGFDLSW